MSEFPKSKGKALNATQSDESDFEDFKDTPNVGVNYLVFTASLGSFQEPSEYAILDLHESPEDDFEEKDNIQAAYNNIFEEFIKLKKMNKNDVKKLNEIEL